MGSNELDEVSLRTLPPDAISRFGFFGLLRWISANDRKNPMVGEALRPQEEVIRLGQKPSLIFAPREIADISALDDGRFGVNLFGLGILGPNGAMPLQFTDFVRERAESKQDTTLIDFVNLFHHRSFSQLYRAWAIGQATIGLDRSEDERFSLYIDSLGKVPTTKSSRLSSHARLSASAHLVREARNPEGLVKTLAHFFSTPVEIEEFFPRWIDIEEKDYTRLGSPGFSSALGDASFLGEKVLDRQHHFRIVMGPMSVEEYFTFMPGGGNLSKLVEWVRAFVGYEYGWDVEIKVKAEEVPHTYVGGEAQLGWSAWVGEPNQANAVSGFIFEPETAIALIQKEEC
jgi:type VI secretion system protein ImpH